MEINNPFFQQDDFPGSFSLSFTIPLDDNNIKAFGLIHKVESNEDFQDNYNVSLNYFGVPLPAGILEIDKVKQKEGVSEIDVHLEVGVTSLGETFKNKQLNDYDYSKADYDLYDNSSIKTTINQHDAADLADVNDHMKAELFQNSSKYTYWPIWAYIPVYLPWPDDMDFNYDFVNHYWDNISLEYFFFVNELVFFHATPYPSVQYVLSQLLSNNGFSLSGNFFHDEEVQRLMLFSNHLDYIVADHIYKATVAMQGVSLNNVMPANEINKFLLGLAKMFCLGIYTDSRSGNVELITRNSILDTAYAMDLTDKASPDYDIEKNETTGFILKYSFQDSLADDEFEELDEPNLKPSVFDFNSLPTSQLVTSHNDVRLVKQSQNYYKANVDINQNVSWEFVTQNFIKKTHGKEGDREEISFDDVTCMLEYRGTDPYFDGNEDYNDFDNFPQATPSRKWVTPWTNVEPRTNELVNNDDGTPHVSYSLPVYKNEQPYMLFFYRGFHQDDSGNNYPLGQSGNEDILGYSVENYSMRLNTEDGIYEIWWNKYMDFIINAKIVTRNLHLNINDLSNINDFLKNKVMIENQHYMIKTLKFSMTPRGLSPAEAELYMF